MSSETNNHSNCRSKAAYFFAVLAALLIFAALVWKMKQYVAPGPLNAARAEERAKALAELRASEADALNNTGWIDQSKGIVRLKIEDAMQLALRNWQNPSAARSNLIEREEKATYVPPPPPPKPSAFE